MMDQQRPSQERRSVLADDLSARRLSWNGHAVLALL